MIRLRKIARDPAVTVQATTVVTLKAVLVTASGLLRKRLDPQTKKYQVGNSFPARDGCNTCSSNSPKTVICTEADCGCENGGDRNKDYVSESPEECAQLDYVCVEGLTCFHDHCGGGCEQPADCPATIDCEPPTDCSELIKKCPLSNKTL